MNEKFKTPIWVFLAFPWVNNRKIALSFFIACVLLTVYSFPWVKIFPNTGWVDEIFLIDDWSWLMMMIPSSVWYWLSLRWADNNSLWGKRTRVETHRKNSKVNDLSTKIKMEKTMNKILLINGNPKDSSLCHSLAESYAQGARESGYEVDMVNISSLDFQPISYGYENIEPLEPDLVNLQNKIITASHLVFVYPVWWGSVPSLMKSILDKVLLPGFAFKYEKGSLYQEKLLLDKTARLIVTMDTPPWYYKLVYGAPSHKMMKRTVLEFCGVKPVKITEFGSVVNSEERDRIKWISKVKKLGEQAA